MKTKILGISLLSFFINVNLLLWALPVLEEEDDDSFAEEFAQESFNISNNTAKDLLIIKAVVYEVGILTDADNSSVSSESHEQIDLTFYDPKRNGSTIDLSNIPIPIQTNVSGVTVTGVAPINFGQLTIPNTTSSSSNFPLKVPIFPNALISVTHNVSTTNVKNEQNILSSLPDILGIRANTNKNV